MTTYSIQFELDGLEFSTDQIDSETEMMQKREKLKSVADDGSVDVSKYVL